MTAYTLNRLFALRGRHNIDVIVIDNCPGDGTVAELKKLYPEVVFVDYIPGKLQSHGIAFDFVLPHINTEFFITIESDSFPTLDNWLDGYEALVMSGYDAAGSLLKLSGGQYMHPAGAMYRKSVWLQAKAYCEKLDYAYLPNIALKEKSPDTTDKFPCHLMVSNRMFPDFCKRPDMYVELYKDYHNNTPMQIADKALDYSPVVGPFHNGMGQANESFDTYGDRDISTEPHNIILKNDTDFIYRMGYEPGQWFCYFMLATGRKLYYFPTSMIWMPGRQGQQQEYSITSQGFKHLWGVSSYKDCPAEEFQDIVKFKAKQVEDLYNSI